MDRLMKTASLFLGTVKIIERYSTLKLPFSYSDFLKIAQEKIRFQLALIRSTDKLAMFFTAINNMIDTKRVVEGREFIIEQPKKITGSDSRGDKRTFTFESDTHVLFLRLSAVFSIFCDSIRFSEENMSFTYYGRQRIERRTSVLMRELVTEGYLK